MMLRDGVRPSGIEVLPESRNLSELVRSGDQNLIDRLESFEDIISLEVGDTSLTRAKTLERTLGLRQLYIKYEGDNPTGTQKDRIAFAQAHDALRRGFETISLATCGNYGVACALAANLSGLECKIFIPETYHTTRLGQMESLGAEIIRLPGSYEDVVRESSAIAGTREWYDANPGGSNTPLQIAAYARIAYEIYDDLRDAPRICAVPVSNGTLLAGIYRGFVSLYKRGKTSRIPIMIAGSSSQKNPIVVSHNLGLDHCQDLDPKKILETKINEPLINWHSFDGEEALYALRESQGLAFHVSDRRMKEMASTLMKSEGYRILPASTAGLVGLIKHHENEPFEPDRYVAVLTARN